VPGVRSTFLVQRVINVWNKLSDIVAQAKTQGSYEKNEMPSTGEWSTKNGWSWTGGITSFIPRGDVMLPSQLSFLQSLNLKIHSGCSLITLSEHFLIWVWNLHSSSVFWRLNTSVTLSSADPFSLTPWSIQVY